MKLTTVLLVVILLTYTFAAPHGNLRGRKRFGKIWKGTRDHGVAETSIENLDNALNDNSNDEENSNMSAVDCSLVKGQLFNSDSRVVVVKKEDGKTGIIITHCFILRTHQQTAGRSTAHVIGEDTQGGQVTVGAGTGGTCHGNGCSSQTTGGAAVKSGSGAAQSATSTVGDENSDISVGAIGHVGFGK